MNEEVSKWNLKTKDKVESKPTMLIQFGIKKVMSKREATETCFTNMEYSKHNMLIKRKGQVTLRRPDWVVEKNEV